jgi:putative phage-type endonuclease
MNILCATQILAPEASREEWLKTREQGIGGSDVATVIGLSKWKSAYSLWAERVGIVEKTFKESEAMEWGTRLETVIAAKFIEAHPELEVTVDCGTWAHNDRAWQIANPDGVYVTADGVQGILEIKTATYEDDWADGVPRYYQTQVQWYMQTLGLGEAIVAVLFHGNKYREYTLLANKFEQDLNLQRVEKFLQHVHTGVAPDIDGSDSTLETIRAEHPHIDPQSVYDATKHALRYFTTKEQLKLVTEAHNASKAELLSEMGNAKTATVDGEVVFQRQARGLGTPYLVEKKMKAKD